VNDETVKLINLNFTKEQYKMKGIEFLEKIKKSKINNITKQFNHPKISVVIPVYNSEKTIKLSMKSIYFQNIKELEIIFVNDLSSDNSSLILENLQNLDNRIRIINNKRNMGTLYSRCIGTLKAKGEYIIGLDNDDIFFNENVFKIIYLNAKSNDFDIVEIKSFNIPNYSPSYDQIIDGKYIYHPNNLILHQPKLGLFSIFYNNKLEFRDHFAWGKLIKAKIYKKAVNKLGYKRYSLYNCWMDDMLIVFILFNTAKSFIFLNLFGIFRVITNNTTSHKLSSNHKLLSSIYYLDIIFDFSEKDFKIKRLIANYALSFPLNRINKLDNKNKLFFRAIIIKIIRSQFISNEIKKRLNQKFFGKSKKISLYKSFELENEKN